MNQPQENSAEVETTVDTSVDTSVDHTIDWSTLETVDYGAVFERIATALEQIAYQLKQINGKIR